MLQLERRQITSQQKITVRIFEEEDGPYINVIKRYDFAKQQVTPAYLFVNINFGDNIDGYQARRAVNWYTVAANVAEQLDSMFVDRDSLRHWAEVKLWPDYSVEVSFTDFD